MQTLSDNENYVMESETFKFIIKHKDSSGETAELICENGKEICNKSLYFKYLVRNINTFSNQESSNTNYLNKNELTVHLGEELDRSALQWIIWWANGSEDDIFTDIENEKRDSIFDYLVASNFLGIDELVKTFSRIIAKNLDESNFIAVWYNAKVLCTARLDNFIQKAFFEPHDRRRIDQYGCYDIDLTVYELTLKCHKVVLFLMSQDLESNISENMTIDLTPKILEHYKKTDETCGSERRQNLMQAFYNVVSWLYSGDLPFEYDDEVIVAMMYISRAMCIDKHFIPDLCKCIKLADGKTWSKYTNWYVSASLEKPNINLNQY